jgi:hypothetical protein
MFSAPGEGNYNSYKPCSRTRQCGLTLSLYSKFFCQKHVVHHFIMKEEYIFQYLFCPLNSHKWSMISFRIAKCVCTFSIS